MLTDYELRSEFQENYRYAHDFWSPFITDANTYTLAASGYTWSDEERKELMKVGREPIEYNIIRKPLNFYSGYASDHLNSIIYAPVEGSDQKTADQFTKLSYYAWDKANGYNVFLDSFSECLKAGISLVGVYMDYSRDFENGDLAFCKRCYNQFYIDPTFERIDLKDASFLITRDLLSRQSAKELLPFIDPSVIDDLQYGFRDDKFLSYHPQFTNFIRNRNIIAYDQYYRQVSKKREFLIDQNTSFSRDITDLSSEEKEKLRLGLNRFRRMREDADVLGINPDEVPVIDIKTVSRDFVELNILLNGEVAWRGEDRTGINKSYPYVANLCYFEPSIWMPSQRIMGVAGTQYFNQRQFNKRHMKITDMMDSAISTGFKYLLGAVPDPTDLQQTGQQKIIGVEGDPTLNPAGLGAVEQLQGGGANPALMEYQKILNDLSLDLANINETMMGVDEKGNTQVSGRLAEVRLAQGLRGTRRIFDNMEQAQLALGRLCLEVFQKKYSPGKVERIIGEKPTDQFYNSEFEQYDAVIKEGVRSKSQKDAYYYELVTLKREGIVDVPQAEIVRALQMAGLSDLEEAMKQQDRALAKSANTQEQVQQMKLQVLNATKEEKLGLAGERKSREGSNWALVSERTAEAQQNLANAALDRAKAIVEISKLHEDRILQVLQFVQTMEQQQLKGQQMQGAQVDAKSEATTQKVEQSDQQIVAQESMSNMQADITQGV